MQPISPRGIPGGADSGFDNFILFIKSAFGFLEDSKLFGLPLLTWLLIGCMLGIVMSFLRGKKGGDDK